ncbi:MAG: ATP-binding protein [Oscillospiraceae bacterium]|jgi:hypothetical protein|nr:ATP-binding protein [Oscillospiraceae bacterium]
MAKQAPKRIASAVLNALKGGVVPRVGLEYIAVGRSREIEALLRDTEIVADGGSTFRFIVGRYGSGKSFLLQTLRNYAMERGFAVMDADLSPERRLSGTGGQGLATYRELIGNLSTHTKPDGGALPMILEKWISGIQAETAASGAFDIDTPEFDNEIRRRILLLANELEGMVSGFDFARMILIYWEAHRSGDDAAKSSALRWFRGEFSSKTEVRQTLNVRTMIGDDNWYEALKLFASFLVKVGYKGLLVLVDELVNLYRIPFRVTREYNYEKMLSMYNDALQGKARNIGFIMVSTPQSMEDGEKGIFSYEALRSRLSDGRFADHESNDLLSPIIRVNPLTFEELFVLMEKLAQIHQNLYNYKKDIDDEEYIAFLKAEFERIGAKTHITPRSVIRDFIEILNRLVQDPSQTIAGVLTGTGLALTSDDESDATGIYADFEV